MKPHLALIVCSLGIALVACKKDVQLPPVTQNGSNTFGCKVNGKKWAPTFAWPLPGVEGSRFSYSGGGVLSIRMRRREGVNTSVIRIEGIGVDSVGTYAFGAIGSSEVGAGINNNNTSYCDYGGVYDGTQCTGTLEITKLSFTEKVIAGKFNFVLTKPGCETVNVTVGRFDFKLQ